MTLLTEAIAFAAKAHDGMTRRGSNIPYIVHPMEAVAIAASITEDEEVLAAAALHDVMEDCGVTEQTLRERFGAKVAHLVACESQINLEDPCRSWDARKHEAIRKIAHGCREAKIVALADKLSNMRAIHRDYLTDGEALFCRFHQQDMQRHAWYYRSCTALLAGEFSHTGAWQELALLVNKVFGSAKKKEDDACAG